MPCNHSERRFRRRCSSQKQLCYPFKRGDPLNAPVFSGPQLPSAHEPVKDAARRASAVAPSLPSLTVSPLRACFRYARKGKERPFPGISPKKPEP